MTTKSGTLPPSTTSFKHTYLYLYKHTQKHPGRQIYSPNLLFLTLKHAHARNYTFIHNYTDRNILTSHICHSTVYKLNHIKCITCIIQCITCIIQCITCIISHTYTHIHACLQAHMHTHTRTHARRHARTHARTHTHTHTHTQR